MGIVVAGVFVVSAVVVRFARRVALKKALLDHPNERSSPDFSSEHGSVVWWTGCYPYCRTLVTTVTGWTTH